MICTRCNSSIQKGERYHRTKLGPHHWECPPMTVKNEIKLERLLDSTFILGTHIAFRNLGNYWGGKEHKTNEYEVTEKHNVRVILGHIGWFPRWRKYVFEPEAGTVYEETCLREISQFIVEETSTQRKAAKLRRLATGVQK